MKTTTLFIALFFILISNHSEANEKDERLEIRMNFPHLEEVLTYLNKKLEFECDQCAYGVAKKREGYFLTLFDYTSKEKAEVLAWNSASKDFVEFDISDKIDTSKKRTSNGGDLNQFYELRHRFDFMLVYGYKEWAQDAIDILKPFASSLSSKDLEVLARAHGDLASLQIDDSENLRFYAQTDKNKVKAFMNEVDISMDYWLQIKKKDESYSPMIIKDLNLKIGNQYMHFYNILLSLKEEKLAANLLKKVWYTAAQIQSAKDLLYGCPKDGILFTDGDSDTFPLWYVQKKLNYRSDVIVINTSLLYTPWYMQMNKEIYQYASVMNQTNYKGILNRAQYIDPKSQVEPFKQWLTKKMSGEEIAVDAYDLVPGKFIIPYQGVNMEIKLNSTIIGHNDLIILDIIASNPDRPFNFTSPYKLYSFGLSSNFFNRGKSFSLTNTATAFSSDKESIAQLDNLIFYMDGRYIESLSHTATNELGMLCYGISALQPAFAFDKDRLTKKLLKQLPYTDVLKLENYQIFEILNSFYEEQAPGQSIALKRQLEPIAIDRISEISAVNRNLDNDISDLEELFSIYAGVRVQLLKYEEAKIMNSDRRVLREMKSKIDSLYDNPVIMNREWSRLHLAALKEALDGMDLTER